MLFMLLPLLLPFLCAVTARADVIDPCDTTGGPGNYLNLTSPGQDYIGWNDPPDEDYLCQKSNRRTASATYYCPGAREVTVALYSRYGSYASGSGDALVRGGDELPLWYRSATGEVYCDGRRMAYDAELGEFVFLEEEGRPTGLVEYGLSVYCSRDGRDYTRVSAGLVSAWREGPDAYWYEVYRADLEEGSRYLRLVLTDQSSIEIVGREQRYEFETVGGLSLASVEIIGGEEAASTFRVESREPGSAETSESRREEVPDRQQEDTVTGEITAPGTGSLPSYRPGEEEGPEELPWGPDEETDGPAFPDETPEEQETEEKLSEEKASSGGNPAASSKGASKTQQKGSSKAGKGEDGSASRGETEAALQGKQLVQGEPAPALRREVPLWRRVLEPDAMSMMIIAVVLLTMGIRILWEEGGDNRVRGRKSEQEERYARYMSYGRGSRQSGSGQRPRRGQTRWYDEGPEDDSAGWEEPGDWDDR